MQNSGYRGERRSRSPSSADFAVTGRIRRGEQVCRIAGFQTRLARDFSSPADLEIVDTAGFETCATTRWRAEKFSQACENFRDTSTKAARCCRLK